MLEWCERSEVLPNSGLGQHIEDLIYRMMRLHFLIHKVVYDLLLGCCQCIVIAWGRNLTRFRL